ncbi:MAG: hypothetical protein EA378_06860 [Phycisphaerales bacterium]|nr:MAG: hypothetical protein EA378_06860 [Phycisphaerales bacterium]
MPTIRRAHAKLNLALAVAPPDPHRHGWHPIASWMHAIDLADELTIEHADTTSFDLQWLDPAGRTHPVEWATEADLVARAHAALEAHAARPLPARVTLRKRTPAGGGLGGGSSDAAAALFALHQHHRLRLPAQELQALAHTLGSDVPFFLKTDPTDDPADDPTNKPDRDPDQPPRPALVEAFGERLTRTPPLPALGVVLICPPFPCATPEVYRAFDTDPGAAEAFRHRAETVRRLAHEPPPGDDPRELSALLFNDLEPAARRVEPRLGELLDACRAALPAPVHMTGSGSTLFALTPPGQTAETAAEARRASRAFQGTRVLETSLR